MQNKKAQKALSVLTIVTLLIAVFSIAFMTESEEVIKKKNELSKTVGMEIISGMVVLSDILDSISEEEREILISAKDGNFYLIRKKGYEWYYGDTTIKVTADSMDTGFNYYRISSLPSNIKITSGAPYCEDCKVEIFGELITGMVTGMEGVSGYAVKEYDLASAQAGYKAKEFKIGDEVNIKGNIYEVRGNVQRTLSETQQPVLFKADSTNNIGETLFGSKAAYLDQNQQVIITNTPIKTANDMKEGDRKSCSRDLCRQVDGSYISGSEFQSTQSKTFYIQKPSGEYIKLSATTAEDAEREKMMYGDPNIKVIRGDKLQIEKEKESTTEQLLSGKQRYIIQIEKPDGQTIQKEIWATESGKDAIASNRAGYEGGTLVGEPQRPKFTVTVENLGQFKNVEANNQKEAENKIRDSIAKGLEGVDASKLKVSAVQQQLEGAPKPPEEYEYNSFKVDGVEKHVVIAPDGTFQVFKSEREARAKVEELNIQLNIQKYEKSAEEYAKNNDLTLQSERDWSGLRYARDKDGKLYYFDKNAYVPYSDDEYRTYETIGKGDDTVYIIRTHKTDTKEVTEIRVTKDGESATVDEETVKQIKGAQGKGLKLGISSVDKNQILEFEDKDGNLVARTTLSAVYIPQAGTKTTEQFKTAYFYDEEEISKEEYEKLKKEGKEEELKEVKEFPTFKREETTEEGKLKYLTDYKFDTKFKDKKPIRLYEGTKFDVEKGELVGFIYGEIDAENKETFIILNDKGERIGGDGNEEMLSKAKTALSQYKSRQFFSNLDFAFTEFRGLGYYATWFMSDEELEEWREGVDKFFAEAYLGIEYWVSEICSSKIDRDQKGVAYVNTRLGLAGVAAHIESTRSYQIISQNASEYLYKITFYVKNGDWEHDPKALEEMEFNIYLYGDRTSKLLSQDKKLKRGEAYGRLIENAIVQYTEYYYDRICIKFKEVPSFWTLDDKELCNTIQGPSKGAERAYGEEVPEEQDETVGGEFLEI